MPKVLVLWAEKEICIIIINIEIAGRVFETLISNRILDISRIYIRVGLI